MTAKKNIIKDLRQEIRELEATVKSQNRAINAHNRQIDRILNSHIRELSSINTWTNNIANTLKFKFNKELTWMTLCDDPDSKFRYINEVIVYLHSVAKPLIRDDDD